MTKKLVRVGVDVGGVILHLNPMFSSMKDAQFVDGAIDALTILSSKYELYIVSFCLKDAEVKLRQQLKGKVPIDERNWIFVRKRSDKVYICEQYNISIMIDDTYQIHQSLMRDASDIKRVWFSPNGHPHHKHIGAANWNEVIKLL